MRKTRLWHILRIITFRPTIRIHQPMRSVNKTEIRTQLTPITSLSVRTMLVRKSPTSITHIATNVRLFLLLFLSHYWPPIRDSDEANSLVYFHLALNYFRQMGNIVSSFGLPTLANNYHLFSCECGVDMSRVIDVRWSIPRRDSNVVLSSNFLGCGIFIFVFIAY